MTMLSTLLLVVLLLLVVGALPTWPYSRSWGYYPSGGLGLIVVVVLVLFLLAVYDELSLGIARHNQKSCARNQMVGIRFIPPFAFGSFSWFLRSGSCRVIR